MDPRTDVIEAALGKKWGELIAARSDASRAKLDPTAPEYKPIGVPIAHRSKQTALAVDTKAAQQHKSAMTLMHKFKVVKPKLEGEGENENVNMRNIPIYQPGPPQPPPLQAAPIQATPIHPAPVHPAAVQPVAVQPNTERVIPHYRPHLGTRADYEKQYGLPPGGSYTVKKTSMNQGQLQLVRVKQESMPLRDITTTNAEFNAPKQVPAEVVKQEFVPETPTFGFSGNNQPATPIHQTPAPVTKSSEISWDTADEWSQQRPRTQPRETPSRVKQESAVKQESVAKQENVESSEVKFILSNEDEALTLFSPPAPTTSGLASSRYASAAPRASTTPVVKKENTPIPARQPGNAFQHNFGQALADPIVFMSVAVGAGKQVSPEADLVKPSTAENVAVQQAPAPPVASQGSSALTTRQSTNSKSPEKVLGSRAYPNSGSPRFPPHEGTRPVGAALRWGPSAVDFTKSAAAFTTPSTVTAHIQPKPSKTREEIIDETMDLAISRVTKQVEPVNSVSTEQAAATSQWQDFAATESKKNAKSFQTVQFVQSGWDDTRLKEHAQTLQDVPVAKAPVENSTIAPSKVPTLVGASKWPNYDDNTPRAGTPAPPSECRPQVKPLSEVVNADKVMIKNLQAQLGTQGSRLETVEQELEAYKEERSGLDLQLTALHLQVDQTTALRAENEDLKQSYDSLKKILETPPTPGHMPTAAQMEWLTQRNKELELENHLKEPLFRIGRDVRAQFLEEGRDCILKIGRRDIDKSVLERGHAASSNAISEADATLLNGGFLTNAELKKYVPVFHSLYGEYPDVHYKVAEKMREAMDALATCMTSPGCNSKHPSLPKEQLQRVQRLVKFMGEKYGEMEPKEFQEDAGGHAEKHLELIREAMGPIVKFDRKWSRIAIKEKLEREAAAASSITTKSPEKK